MKPVFVRMLHSIGLTNLSNEQIEAYELLSWSKEYSVKYSIINVRSKVAIIGAASSIIAAFIIGIFGLFQGWYTKSRVDIPPQKETVQIQKREITEVKKPHGKQDAYKDNKAKFQIGDEVLAMRKEDKCLYPAKVRKIEKEGYYISYDFSVEDEELVKEEDIYSYTISSEADLRSDTKVFIQFNLAGQNKWIPANIKEIRNSKYYVTYSYNNENEHAWLTKERIILRR